jgi:CDP-6-deoxy-D-xylo-4-hexulose-3-dehydrase
VDIVKYLDQYKIGTRLLFAGNLINQPYFQGIEYRISGSLENTDRTMNQTFWLGVQPTLGEEHYNFVAEKMEEFFGVNF